jgi:integrase/recombinase XerC
MSDQTDPTVQKFIEYLRHERRFSDHTLRSYGATLQSFCDFIAGKAILECDLHTIREYLAQIYDAGVARSTTRNRLSAMKSFWRFAIRRELVKKSPLASIRSPKRDRRLPRFLNQDQILRLIKSPHGKDVLAARDRAILETLYSTGMRVGELVKLTVADLNLEAGTVRVVMGKGRKDRIAPIGKHASKAIVKYFDAMFGTPNATPRPTDRPRVFPAARIQDRGESCRHDRQEVPRCGGA